MKNKPKQFRGIPKRPPKFFITEEVITKKITVKKGDVEMHLLIGQKEMEILGISPTPKYFRFKNRKNPKTVKTWANVLECMQKLVKIIKLEIEKEENE